MFIPNQPIHFGLPDLNQYPLCGCRKGKGYYQPISQNDITRFLLPNICHKTLSGNIVLQGEFTNEAQFNEWSQGTGNGNSVAWTYNSGKARTLGNSKILNILFSPFIEPYVKYKITVSSDLCTDAIIHVVGYKSYSGDSSTDYTEITTLETGVQSFEFIATETYIRIGFWVEGGCTEDFSDVEYFRLYEYQSQECITICLKDENDNTVESDIGELTYYHDFIAVSIDWSSLAIDNGCYKLCICSEDTIFAENLFTDADNGTFEDADVTGITGTGTASTEQAYLGDYSYKIVIDGTASQNIITLTSTYKLKRNTTYQISTRVYIDASFTPVADAYLAILPDFIGDTLVTNGNIEPSADNRNWAKAYTTFTTGDNPSGTFDVLLSGNDWSLYNGVSLYIDEIFLYEVDAYEPCSQMFRLKEDWDCSLLFTYYNEADSFGFIYPEGFEFTLRVEGSMRLRYPETLAQSKNGETGNTYNYYAKSEKVKSVRTGFLPEWMHDALRLAVIHNNLNINGIDYVKVPGEYAPGEPISDCLSTVEFEVIPLDQNTVYTSC